MLSLVTEQGVPGPHSPVTHLHTFLLDTLFHSRKQAGLEFQPSSVLASSGLVNQSINRSAYF